MVVQRLEWFWTYRVGGGGGGGGGGGVWYHSITHP